MLATANRQFVIVARRTVADPRERARRLALAFGVFERRRKVTAVMGDVSEAQPTTAASTESSKRPDS